ncbi:DUF7210 family protein [Stenotrophomonas sp. LC732]|uniref:DUF7210 family protein n=1 Tax=Stenotrophomonas sp. LC732 TaxID=3458628 RepID=UPI00403667A2
MNEAPVQKLVEVTLDKPHTHAGVQYDAKAKIKVSEADREWLVANRVVTDSKEK